MIELLKVTGVVKDDKSVLREQSRSPSDENVPSSSKPVTGSGSENLSKVLGDLSNTNDENIETTSKRTRWAKMQSFECSTIVTRNVVNKLWKGCEKDAKKTMGKPDSNNSAVEKLTPTNEISDEDLNT